MFPVQTRHDAEESPPGSVRRVELQKAVDKEEWEVEGSVGSQPVAGEAPSEVEVDEELGEAAAAGGAEEQEEEQEGR